MPAKRRVDGRGGRDVRAIHAPYTYIGSKVTEGGARIAPVETIIFAQA